MVGIVEEKLFTGVFVRRGELPRFISVRRSNKGEAGYKGQGKTQPRTAAVYDNPFAWDARAAYVIGTRHRDDYRLFVPRDLAPDLDALAEQILRPRDDRGSSLRFATAEEYQARQQQQRAATASKVFRAALDNSRAVRAAKAARKRLQSEGQAPPPNPETEA
ncbi:MAG: hypothetical protein LGL72_18240, partial [Acidibrevibacterium sp.]|nr:hypothetical protein [Acidibrevibacterium fodinaquatile]